MIYTNAVFSHKNNDFEPQSCVVEKVVRLSGNEYDSFSHNMNRDQRFIRDNVDLMRRDPDGQRHCLLIVGDDRRDGILVESSGYDYARYSAFIPNAKSFLLMEQYPALAALNKKLTDIVDYIVEQMNIEKDVGDYVAVDLRELEVLYDISIMDNDVVRNVITDMLTVKPEIADWEIEGSELHICDGPVQTAVGITDEKQQPETSKKQSVMVKIKAARQNPQPPRERVGDKKDKGGPEL